MIWLDLTTKFSGGHSFHLAKSPVEGVDRLIPGAEGQGQDRVVILARICQGSDNFLNAVVVQERIEISIPQMMLDELAQTILWDRHVSGQIRHS